MEEGRYRGMARATRNAESAGTSLAKTATETTSSDCTTRPVRLRQKRNCMPSWTWSESGSGPRDGLAGEAAEARVFEPQAERGVTS